MDRQIMMVWVAISILFILVLVRPMGKSFYSGNDSIMDLAEFQNVPLELKTLYKQEFVGKVTNQAGQIIAQEWTVLTPEQKQVVRDEARMSADNLTNNMIINNQIELFNYFNFTIQRIMYIFEFIYCKIIKNVYILILTIN
jgi:hypothetical protein